MIRNGHKEKASLQSSKDSPLRETDTGPSLRSGVFWPYNITIGLDQANGRIGAIVRTQGTVSRWEK